MSTHSILSTGPLLADTDPIDDTQTSTPPKVGRDEAIQSEEEVSTLTGEEDPDQPQTGGTVKTGRTEPTQPERED